MAQKAAWALYFGGLGETPNEWRCLYPHHLRPTLPSLLTSNGIPLTTGQLAAWYNQPVIRTLTQAYAITVHKSQGSEYDTVYLPIMRNFSGMMNRNLRYTAISCGKKQVVLVGDPDTLELALQKLPPKRRSMLV